MDAQPAPRHGQAGPWQFNYTLPYSLCGWPAVVVRAGTSAAGLPIGVQVVTSPWREEIALAVALAIEDALGGRRPPPL